ncbi:hypothetical protein ABPG74_010550 [Tetrahymena malaccensis]
MINPGIPFKMVAPAPNNPFLQMPLLQQQQQFIIDPSGQQQMFAIHQNQQQQQQQQLQQQFNNLVSASALEDCDSGSNSDGESQVLTNNPETAKQYFDDFLKLTQQVDPSNIQLSTVIEQYNISFKNMPNDEEMKAEFNRMLQKYNSSSQKGQKKNWNDNETKILCWIVIKACALQNLDCRHIEDKIWDDIAKMMIGRTSESCKFKWLSLSKLNLQQIPWSTEEDALLLSIIKDYNASNKGNKWSEISKELNSRSKKNVFRQGKQCRERWNNHLDPNINRGPWHDKEDLQLLKLILDKGKKWSDVSKELKSNRTENNVKNRFNSIIKKEKQNIEETKGKAESNMPENELINILIKKYTTRISQGFTLNCKEEDQSRDQQAQDNNQKTESPLGKIEKQKNKLKDLVQKEIKTKENQTQSAGQQSNSMVLEDQNQLNQQKISQNQIGSFFQFNDGGQNSSEVITNQQQQQLQQQQQQQQQQYQQQYQQYINQQLTNQAVNPEQYSPNTFNKAFLAQAEQISQCSMSPGNSQQNTPLQQHHNQGLLQLFSANGGYIAANPTNVQTQIMQPYLNQTQQQGQQQPFQQQQPQQSQFYSQSQQQKQLIESPQTYKIRNAMDLLNQNDAASNMSLAFFNPQTQELVEIDHQLLEEYTKNQVRIQLQQYAQNIKSSTSQLQTPVQTPQQTPQPTFQIMFHQLQNQMVGQAGSNSPQQYQLYNKANSPNLNAGIINSQAGTGLSQQQHQQLMGIIGTPISPQTNLLNMMQNMSPVASGYNTPNNNNNNNNQTDIRSIGQMQQYSNFFMNNANNMVQQSQQFPIQTVQGQLYMQANANNNTNFTKDQINFSPSKQNFATQYNQINQH